MNSGPRTPGAGTQSPQVKSPEPSGFLKTCTLYVPSASVRRDWLGILSICHCSGWLIASVITPAPKRATTGVLVGAGVAVGCGTGVAVAGAAGETAVVVPPAAATPVASGCCGVAVAVPPFWCAT